MRPKKTILLVDGDERRASLRRFVLEQRRYAVYHRTSLEHFKTADHITNHFYGVDLLILSDTVPLGKALIGITKQINPETRALLLQDRIVPRQEEMLADAVTAWDSGHALEVLTLIRTLVARKRGPKSPSLRPNPPALRSAA